ADSSGSRADQHDLVGVFLGGDLAGEDVIERVDLEGGAAVAIPVEIGVHQRARVGADLQAPELHVFAEVDLDVRSAQVEALRRYHHRQRRIELIVVLHYQRLGAHPAVDVRIGIQVAQGCSASTD